MVINASLLLFFIIIIIIIIITVLLLLSLSLLSRYYHFLSDFHLNVAVSIIIIIILFLFLFIQMMRHFAITLRRLSYPRRYLDMLPLGRDISKHSRIFNTTIDVLYDC